MKPDKALIMNMVYKTLIFEKTLLLFLLSGFVISCSAPDNKRDTRARVLLDEEDTREERNSTDRDSRDRDRESNSRSSRSSCVQRDGPLSFFSGDFDIIDSNNVGQYEIRGRCEGSRSVVIKINNYRVSDDPACDRKRFKLELDLSAVSSEEKEILIEASHNGYSICKKVRVGFLGPKNYIPVPSREDQYEASFYVMKYEAKLENKGSSSAKAVSKPEDDPISRVSYDEAVMLCRNNGPRYDLIKNSQWQNIALAIEETDINWSRGRRGLSDDNALNCGVTLGAAKPANSDDQKDCADSTCNTQWDFKRRTHILSNGQIIWDFCGNVGEIMKDKYTLDVDFEGYVFELSGRLKKLFGPDRTYSSGEERARRHRGNYYWGLGEADIENDHNLIVRGGNGRSGNGIFSVSVKQDQEDRRVLNQLGFRCVYIP